MISRSPKTSFGCAGCAGRASEKCPDSRRQFLGGERLRQIVVRACFQSGDHIVSVGTRGDHHDRNVTRTTNGATQFEPIDARKHDVDQDDIGWFAEEEHHGFLTTGGLIDDPTLVLEGQFHRGPDAFVVFHRQDSRAHSIILPDDGSGRTSPWVGFSPDAS